MSKHTPGPWVVLDYLEPQRLDQVEMQYAVLVEGKHSWLCYAFREDDARLMAAAPEMLDALRRAAMALAFAAESSREMLDDYNAVSAAIAKVTGGAA
jgi:hypothetical protein